MILLITDTSGKQGSVGLARADESPAAEQIQVLEATPLVGGTFSAQLVPQIAALLGKHGLTKADIDAFVVVSGPGSFTGLRVGLAAIKALAEILKKPIVAVSLLEVVAMVSGRQGKVLAALDAGRGGVFAGQYETVGENAVPIQEQWLRKEELAASAHGFVIATPDDSVVEVAREANLSVSRIATVGAEMIARLGWKKLHAGETISPEQLDANYGRRSDAEIFVKSSS